MKTETKMKKGPKTMKRGRTGGKKTDPTAGLWDDKTENTEESRKIFSDHDLVFCKGKDGKISSCGYKIDSRLLESIPASRSPRAEEAAVDATSFFQNKAVPMGVFHMNRVSSFPGEESIPLLYVEREVENDPVIDDDLFNKLVSMTDDTPVRFKTAITRKQRPAP